MLKSTRTSFPAFLALSLLAAACGGAPEAAPSKPNIILIMTDDQGWGQLGSHGDDVLQTPRLDQLAKESVELERFYVSPVCAPTRSSLMTGRYNYRTGVVDTYLGRALMSPDEVTIAEMLSAGGYRTGIYGKWHLGDNYPMRAIDQGYDDAVLHKGGGIGQPSDTPGTDYFDPILYHNGVEKKYEGYCTDIYFNEAMRFIDEPDEKPFFIYIPTNAPHSPYLVPDSYREPYAAQGLDDKDARIYGMITNIDDNVGRLLDHLDAAKLAENTIFIFMTDNGPTTQRYTAGLRAQKASVYEDGIRVPFFLRWPERLQPKKLDTVAAHIDVTPTLLAAAGVEPSPRPQMDGRNLLPLLSGEATDWPERYYFQQIHRGDTPELYRAFTVIGQQYKLVQPLSFSQPAPPDAKLELYDLIADPGEQHDLSDDPAQAARVAEMKAAYEVWFADVSSTRGYAPQRIFFGTEHENPVTLTRQDWRVIGEDGWGPGSLGAWYVDNKSAGTYDVRVDFKPARADGRLEFSFQGTKAQVDVKKGDESADLAGLQFEAGEGVIDARLIFDGKPEGVWFVHLKQAQ